ncbi:MAG: UDP-galactopyranose mutase [Cyclobacteriaceae bacterium]
MVDYLIVGAGLFGAVFARMLTDHGKKCLVIDKRDHIGGNCFTEAIGGINVHKYGAHIFHTNNESIWRFVNRYAEFNSFVNSPVAVSGGRLYSLPFNMWTFNQMWGVVTPEEAIKKIEEQKFRGIPANLEEQALSMVGKDVYEKLIKGYTEKQWMAHPKDLPKFIITRLPVRFTYNNNYFSDKYQGIPIGGYTQIFKKLLLGIEVKLNTDFFLDRGYFEGIANKIIYTGPIDRFFSYRFGELNYRTLRFENKLLEMANFQGNAVVNYTDLSVPYTRIIEHKHFEFGTQDNTVITHEYPEKWAADKVPYYPVNDLQNNEVFTRYQHLAREHPNYIFGGRLADYKYYDMHQVIGSALARAKAEIETNLAS